MEVVLALGLVVIMALAIVGIFSLLMSRSSYSADQAAAQLLAQSLLIIPILIRLILPSRASSWLKSFGGWLEKHNDRIVMIVSLVFGLLFLYQGITGLL